MANLQPPVVPQRGDIIIEEADFTASQRFIEYLEQLQDYVEDLERRIRELES